uniref:Secreted protein n=1 Tax=Romanomermis culicivorax TaxID=13658 RepID=A0A915KQ67_ROMCU
MAEILPICLLSVLSLEPNAIFGIVGAGLVGVAPKACVLCDARVISACRSVEAVDVCLSRLRLVMRALLPVSG